LVRVPGLDDLARGRPNGGSGGVTIGLALRFCH
jgi:hypothetical protein